VTPLYPQKLALTSPTGGGRSVGIVRSRTKATEFSFLLHIRITLASRSTVCLANLMAAWLSNKLAGLSCSPSPITSLPATNHWFLSRSTLFQCNLPTCCLITTIISAALPEGFFSLQSFCARFQASATKWKRTALFWAVT